MGNYSFCISRWWYFFPILWGASVCSSLFFTLEIFSVSHAYELTSGVLDFSNTTCAVKLCFIGWVKGVENSDSILLVWNQLRLEIQKINCILGAACGLFEKYWQQVSDSYWTGFHDSKTVTAGADNHCSICLFRLVVKTNSNEKWTSFFPFKVTVQVGYGHCRNVHITEAFKLLCEYILCGYSCNYFSGEKNEGACKTKSNFIHQLKHSCIPRIMVIFGGFDDQGKSAIISQKLRYHWAG